MSGQVKKKSGNILLCREIVANLLKALNLDQRVFALKAGISPDTFQKAINRGKFSTEIIRSVHDAFGINPEYMKEMKGEMFDVKHTPAIKSEQADILDSPLVRSFVEQINLQKEMIEMLKRDLAECRGKK